VGFFEAIPRAQQVVDKKFNFGFSNSVTRLEPEFVDTACGSKVAVHGGGFLLGFAHASFMAVEIEGEADTLRRALMEEFGGECRQITAWTPDTYLPWPTSRRLQVSDLEVTPHRPESWDGLDAIRDLRDRPEQRAFMARLPEPDSPAVAIER
jgi:hypothetical protein